MTGIPDDKVQAVRDRVDLVDLVGRYVELRRAGQNHKGLCPFHQERTPSFNVNPSRRGFVCFGCGAKGDAFAFLMQIEGLSFPEALRKLADLYGIALDLDPVAAGRMEEQRSEREVAEKVLELACKSFERALTDEPEGATGRTYLEARHIPRDLAARFRLGYAPAPSEAGWDRLARVLAQSREPRALATAERLGLVGRSQRTGTYYDRFRGRLIFPVLRPSGEVVGFSGRIVPPHDIAAPEPGGVAARGGADNAPAPPPKYMNSPESAQFHKGQLLFGLHAARPAIRSRGRVILVEGNVDVLTLHRLGFSETVAPLGTAFTEDQARLIGRFTRQVVLCFDGDAAGRKAAFAALPLLLDQDIDPRIVVLDATEDPDSADPSRLVALLESPPAALEIYMTRLAARAGGLIDERSRGLDRVLPLIEKVQRESARFLYAERAASLFGFPPSSVHRALAKKNRSQSSTSTGAVSVSAPVPSGLGLPRAQADLVALLVDAPHLAPLAERAGALVHVTDPRLSRIAAALVDSARRGGLFDPTELLASVDPWERGELERLVFSGRFSAEPDDATRIAPEQALAQLLRTCEEHVLSQKISELDARAERAKDRGHLPEVRELARERLELRRRQAELRSAPTAIQLLDRPHVGT